MYSPCIPSFKAEYFYNQYKAKFDSLNITPEHLDLFILTHRSTENKILFLLKNAENLNYLGWKKTADPGILWKMDQIIRKPNREGLYSLLCITEIARALKDVVFAQKTDSETIDTLYKIAQEGYYLTRGRLSALLKFYPALSAFGVPHEEIVLMTNPPIMQGFKILECPALEDGIKKLQTLGFDSHALITLCKKPCIGINLAKIFNNYPELLSIKNKFYADNPQKFVETLSLSSPKPKRRRVAVSDQAVNISDIVPQKMPDNDLDLNVIFDSSYFEHLNYFENFAKTYFPSKTSKQNEAHQDNNASLHSQKRI